jgi:putative membrane protein
MKQIHKIAKYLMLIFVVIGLTMSAVSSGSASQAQNYLFMIISTLVFVALVWADMFYVIKKKSLWFIFLAVAISFTSEYLGVNHGTAFGGSYYYTHLLGPMLGGVPLVVIAMWTAVVYVCYRIAVLIAGKKEKFKNTYERVLEFLIIALLSGLAAVSWDLIWDPLAVKINSWTWIHSSPYFGIPLSNFTGWILVVFLSALIFEATTKNEKNESKDAVVPLLGYFYLLASSFILALKLNEPHFALLGFILMSPYLLIIILSKIKK